MARMTRAEVFAPDEIAILQVMARVVRRCFLLGTDPVTGRNYDHRKRWIEQRIEHLAAAMGIDLCRPKGHSLFAVGRSSPVKPLCPELAC